MSFTKVARSGHSVQRECPSYGHSLPPRQSDHPSPYCMTCPSCRLLVSKAKRGAATALQTTPGPVMYKSQNDASSLSCLPDVSARFAAVTRQAVKGRRSVTTYILKILGDGSCTCNPLFMSITCSLGKFCCHHTVNTR